MRWIVPRSSLDQRQQIVLDGLVEDPRNAWVDGFAGSGKSMVAIHLAHALAKKLGQAETAGKVALCSFTNALVDLLGQSLRQLDAEGVHVSTYHELLYRGGHWKVIVLDEVQDVPPHRLRQLASIADRIVVAGDVDQSIYQDGLGEFDLRDTIDPLVHRLTIVHRLTERMRAVATAILPGARIQSGEQAGRRADADIRRIRFTDARREAAWIYEDAKSRARPGYPSAILLPNHGDIRRFADHVAGAVDLPVPPRRAHRKEGRYTAFNTFWRDEGIPLMFLGNGEGQLARSDAEPLVLLMTYHSSKGLDFRDVYLPCLTPNARIDPTELPTEDRARRILFVAVTRSRENLFLSFSGAQAHPLISDLGDDLVVDVVDPAHLETGDDGGLDVFF